MSKQNNTPERIFVYNEEVIKKNILITLISIAFTLLCLLLFVIFPKITIIPFFPAIFALIPYYISIYRALLKKQLDLSVPSIITIYLLLYLEKGNVALIFILIILLGQLFKTIILERIKSSIDDISKKLPKTAVIKDGKTQKEILIADIKIGDVLLVKSGERLATDASLLSGDALIDESVVTGESRFIPKKAGDKLLAGSINMGNYLEAKAVSTAAQSTLLQIQKLVVEAQNDKAPLAKIVNRYAWATIVMALAGVMVIYLLTQNILLALSFWIAVVPVVFAIIVPVATTIGITILAKNGVLVKNSTTLENLIKADTILFDKTGTLTEGVPVVEKILENGMKQEKILQIAASIESYSNHPLAKPILDEAKERKISVTPLTHVETKVGKGMTAKWGNESIFLGNIALLRELKIKADNKITTDVLQWENKGATPVFVGEGAKIVGVILLLDKLRPEVKPLFAFLKKKTMKWSWLQVTKKRLPNQLLEIYLMFRCMQK